MRNIMILSASMSLFGMVLLSPDTGSGGGTSDPTPDDGTTSPTVAEVDAPAEAAGIDLNGNSESDVSEVVDGVESFISAEAGLLENAFTSSVSWLKGELAGLPAAAVSYLGGVIKNADADPANESTSDVIDAVISTVRGDAEGVEPEVVTALKAISDDAVEAFTALTVQPVKS